MVQVLEAVRDRGELGGGLLLGQRGGGRGAGFPQVGRARHGAGEVVGQGQGREGQVVVDQHVWQRVALGDELFLVFLPSEGTEKLLLLSRGQICGRVSVSHTTPTLYTVMTPRRLRQDCSSTPLTLAR